MITAATEFGGVQLYCFEVFFKEENLSRQITNNYNQEQDKFDIELGPVIQIVSPNAHKRKSKGNRYNKERLERRRKRKKETRRKWRTERGKIEREKREQKEIEQAKRSQYYINQREKYNEEARYMVNPKELNNKVEIPNVRVEKPFVPARRHTTREGSSQDPVTQNNQLILLDSSAKELSMQIYGQDYPRDIILFERTEHGFQSVLNANFEGTVSRSSEGVTVNDMPIEKGSLHAKVISDYDIPKRQPNQFFLKNVGWTSGVRRPKARKDLEGLAEATKNRFDLFCLQEAKLVEPELPTLKNGHVLKKHDFQDQTAFMVSKELESSRVTRLEPEGRISVIYHQALPCLIFNVYMTVNNYEKQMEQAKVLDRAGDAAQQNGQQMMMFGDWNNVPDHGKDIVEKSDRILAVGRKHQAHEKEVTDFLENMFHRFGLVDIFRHQNPLAVGATNHPYHPQHAERRIDRVYVHRFDAGVYLYKIINENRRLSTHDLLGLIAREDINTIYGQRRTDLLEM